MKETISLKRKLYGEDAHATMRRPEFWAIDSVGRMVEIGNKSKNSGC
jgi:hypothetical protein